MNNVEFSRAFCCVHADPFIDQHISMHKHVRCHEKMRMILNL